MENFDRENIDELLKIRQIRQYFPPSKFCAVRYVGTAWLRTSTFYLLNVVSSHTLRLTAIVAYSFANILPPNGTWLVNSQLFIF